MISFSGESRIPTDSPYYLTVYYNAYVVYSDGNINVGYDIIGWDSCGQSSPNVYNGVGAFYVGSDGDVNGYWNLDDSYGTLRTLLLIMEHIKSRNLVSFTTYLGVFLL